MMKRCILLAISFFISVSTAMAAVTEGQFSLSTVIGGYTYDGSQHLDTSPVYGLRAGFNITKHVGVEALLDYASTRTESGKSSNMFRYGGQVLYHFFPDTRFVPYLAAGFAGIDFSSSVPKSESHGIFDYGVGAKYFLADSFALRADIRHLITTSSTPRSNMEYTVGAYIPFGGTAPAAKPVEVSPAPAAKISSPPAAAPASNPPKAAAAEPAKQTVASYPAVVKRSCNIPAVLNINFDFDKADIKPQYYTELKIDGDFMKEYPEAKGEISGHTDSIGPPDYNQKLSEMRADNVKKYLVEKFGVEASRLSIRGYGETKPVDSNKTAAGRARNRRIEAIFNCN